MTASKDTFVTNRKFKLSSFEQSEVAGIELIAVPPSVIQWRLFDCSKCRKVISDESAKLSKFEITISEEEESAKVIFRTKDAFGLVPYQDDDPVVFGDKTIQLDSKYIQIHNAILYTHFMMATPANRARRFGFKNVHQLGMMMRLFFVRCVDPDMEFLNVRVFCFMRILASWVDMLDVTVANLDSGVFLLKTMLDPFCTAELRHFEVYTKMHVLFKKLYLGFGNNRSCFENVFQRSNVGLDILRAFIHLKTDVYMHRRFVMECMVYFRELSPATTSYHSDFIQLVHELDYKVPNDNSEIVLVSSKSEESDLDNESQATRLKILFYAFACDNRICPKVVTALIMCIGTPDTKVETWEDRIAVMNACDTPYIRHIKTRSDVEVTAYLDRYSIRYPPPAAKDLEVVPLSTLKFKSLRMLGKPRKPTGFSPQILTIAGYKKNTTAAPERGRSGMKFLPKVNDESYSPLYNIVKFIDCATCVNVFSFDIEREVIEDADLYLPIYQSGEAPEFKVFHFEQTLFHKI